MSSLIQSYDEVMCYDKLNTLPLLNINNKKTTPKFSDGNRVGTLFSRNSYFYKLDNNIDTYKYTGEFTVCFWCKFLDKGLEDEAYPNSITVILNDNTVIQEEIPSTVTITNYHWVKIERDSNNLIDISIDGTSIGTQTSSEVFSLADNSYIFVGNTNRYFTGYDVIVDDILIFNTTKADLSIAPSGYLDPNDFRQLLYIRVSDNSVWGYNYIQAQFDEDAWSSMVNINEPSEDKFKIYVTTKDNHLYSFNPIEYSTGKVESDYLSNDCVFNGESSIVIDGTNDKFLKLLRANDSMNPICICCWVKFTSSDCELQLKSGDTTKLYIKNSEVGTSSINNIAQSFSLDTWHYLCITKDNNALSYRIDGGIDNGVSGAPPSAIAIDTITSIGSAPVYIYDVLVVNANNMITGNFTPPISRVMDI